MTIKKTDALNADGRPEEKSQPTVYIVGDDLCVCKSLRWLIETLQVQVETFPNGMSFLQAYENVHPACLILDVNMPGGSGLDLQQELNRRGIEISIIMLTAYGDIPTAVRAIKNDAIEFLEKPFDDEVLLQHVQRALSLDARHHDVVGEFGVVLQRIAQLTPRESEILELMVDGFSTMEIASRLDMSAKTVEKHREEIMRKLEANCIAYTLMSRRD